MRNPKILHEGDIPETNRNINHMLYIGEKYYSYQRGMLAPSHMNFIKSKKERKIGDVGYMNIPNIDEE